jgi:NADH-quinone oxidoreductase subunit L
MLAPLLPLAVGALAAGYVFHDYFIGKGYAEFWRGALFTLPDNKILDEAHHVPGWVVASPAVAMAAGFLVAWLAYVARPGIPAWTMRTFKPIHAFLANKWYFDELYDWLLVRPARRLARTFWRVGDGLIIDGLGPNGIAARVIDVTNRVVKLQTGYVYHYAFVMLIGIALLMSYFLYLFLRSGG